MLFHGPLGQAAVQSLHILSTRLLLSTLQPAQPGTSSHTGQIYESALDRGSPHCSCT
ncbi:Prolipoprotein diacylglyceryl transferase, partial [Clarias magur]